MKHWRSQYSLSRYFTPPKLASLNLDLARLAGGGYAPAQFFGETHDGREVYIRYRGGNFSVTLANEPGVADDTCVDERIGPPLHGGISIAQLCNYFGITINGARPPLPTPEEMLREGCRDLSGLTTFYDVWLSSGLDTQKRLLSAAFPGATLMQPILDQFKVKGYRVCPTIESLTSDNSCTVLGGLTAETVASLAQQPLLHHEVGDCIIQVDTCGFQYPIRKYGNNDAERVHR
jgi:hypothetical protein